MGDAHDATRTGPGAALIGIPMSKADVRSRARLGPDVLVLVGFGTLLVVAAILRREFLGDGVRHLLTIQSNHIQIGEPRWLFFPVVAHLWVQLVSVLGLVHGPESSLRAVLTLCVGAGILFLGCLLIWLRMECEEPSRRTAALLLAGSCAPYLMLFSDIAEPQLAAALVVAGLAFARVYRDDPRRAPAAIMGAAAAIVIASLIYQGVILALGMLPLVVPHQQAFGHRAMVAVVASGVVAMATLLIVGQVALGTPIGTAVTLTFSGEANPMTRTLMASSSPLKYLVAAVMGPPQGIVALRNFGGLTGLWHALRSTGTGTVANGALNLALLFLGLTVSVVLLLRAVRRREWRVLVSAAILLVLPVFRNQQYGYLKFYVLWPIPVALIAIHCRTRMILILAALVLLVNGCLLADAIRQGRERFAAMEMAYARATPSTCWLTSGWSPPFSYRWPGTTAPILGTLATGSEPTRQAAVLTVTLRRCLCDSTAVWSDTSIRDTDVVNSIAQHFGYTSIDLASVLLDPSTADGDPPMPGVLAYSDSSRTRGCEALNR